MSIVDILPFKPKMVGVTLIVNLEYLFPQCDSLRDSDLSRFACCDGNERRCKVLLTCPFATCRTHRKLLEENPDFQRAKCVVGWDKNGFVVLWWPVLPKFAQVKKQVDLEEFFGTMFSGETKKNDEKNGMHDK